ncbi:hypothetical protein [Streptomyces sp. NPDC088733]|uniref:hypothetical protein n=1 Tax=Streptomyces sp. NPDC088733 TaxID=3365880 RepID=UPI00382767BD
MSHHVTQVPDGLSRMAASFLWLHAVRVEPRPLERYREQWREHGISAAAIDRAVAYEARWGGFMLPPAPRYDGGPHVLGADVPDGAEERGWWFAAGDQRCSLPYSFMIGPEGEFGIRGGRWTPLHAHIEGWVESVALAHDADRNARRITQLSGDAVAGLDLDGLDPVPLVEGLADTWWRGPDSLVAVHRGEAEHFGRPDFLTARVYEGLPEHAFWFD